MLTSYLLIPLAALLLLAASLLAQAIPLGNVGGGTLGVRAPVCGTTAATGRVIASNDHYGYSETLGGPPTDWPGCHGRVPSARGQPGTVPGSGVDRSR